VISCKNNKVLTSVPILPTNATPTKPPSKGKKPKEGEEKSKTKSGKEELQDSEYIPKDYMVLVRIQ
jgi:hypothetical protein